MLQSFCGTLCGLTDFIFFVALVSVFVVRIFLSCLHFNIIHFALPLLWPSGNYFYRTVNKLYFYLYFLIIFTKEDKHKYKNVLFKIAKLESTWMDPFPWRVVKDRVKPITHADTVWKPILDIAAKAGFYILCIISIWEKNNWIEIENIDRIKLIKSLANSFYHMYFAFTSLPTRIHLKYEILNKVQQHFHIIFIDKPF